MSASPYAFFSPYAKIDSPASWLSRAWSQAQPGAKEPPLEPQMLRQASMLHVDWNTLGEKEIGQALGITEKNTPSTTGGGWKYNITSGTTLNDNAQTPPPAPTSPAPPTGGSGGDDWFKGLIPLMFMMMILPNLLGGMAFGSAGQEQQRRQLGVNTLEEEYY